MYLNFINNVVEIPIPEEPETPEDPEIPNEPVVPEEAPKEEENPETGTSIITTIIVMCMALILFCILTKINKPKYMMFLIPMILLIPLSIKANEKLQLKITSNIEISVKPTTLVKGEQFNIAIKSFNNETINSYSPSDEVIKHFKRSDEAPSESVTTKVISEEDAQYEVVAWFDGVDTIYWYSEATRIYLNEDCNYMFYYMYKAEEFELNNFDASKMKKAEYMFSNYGNNSSGTSLDLTNWNVENLESAYYMFNSAGRNSESISIDVSNWKVKNVTNANYMFQSIGKSGKKVELKADNLIFKNPTDLNYMFQSIGNESTEEVVISAKNLKLEKAENLEYLFGYVCQKAKKCTLNLENFNAPSALNMSYMITIFAQNALDVTLNLNNLNASKAEKLSDFMSYSAQNVEKIDMKIDNWDISSAKDLSNMFKYLGINASSNFDLDFSTWKTGKIENIGGFMTYAFENSNKKGTPIIKINLSNLDFTDVKKMNGMLDGVAYNAKELHMDLSNWKIHNLEDLGSIAWRAGDSVDYIDLNLSNLELLNISEVGSAFHPMAMSAKRANVNLSNWKITNCGDISTIFYQSFQEVDDLNIDISNWNINDVDDMSAFFYAVGRGSDKVKLIADNWIINNVKDMQKFFIEVGAGAEDFEYSLNNWQLKNVENMNQFFYAFGRDSTKPVTLDLSNWDTSSTTDMISIFSNMRSLSTIYVSELWNTSKVTNSDYMFYDCNNLVGGNGTIFNSSKIDKEYARIDTPETPGYFTLKTTE